MKINYHSISFGADPEFFFSKKGLVIGAEKVLPKQGVQLLDMSTGLPAGKPTIVIDGVQAEFNPTPHYCRQIFSNNLKSCFVKLAEQLAKNEGVSADFVQTVEVSKQEMESLDKSTQQFGCSPSNNAYEKSEISIKDASKYKYRSAGGHVHIGYSDDEMRALLTSSPVEAVKLLDVLVGNTCVLLDRDPGNIERRKVYGRAGEFRSPPHGLEYRTLSNFWIRNYTLMSFVLGMTRFALSVALDKDASGQILSLVNMKKIQEAINTNDFDLAYENFNEIKGIVSCIGAVDAEAMFFPLEGNRVEKFERLVEQGVGHYFKEDPLKFWLQHDYRINLGWERFCEEQVEIKQPELVAA